MDSKTKARFMGALPGAHKPALAVAVTLLRRTRWAGASKRMIADKALDLLHEAITRTLDGSRVWDPERVPDLHYFLGGVVRSLLSAELEAPQADNLPFDTVPDVDHDPVVRGLDRPKSVETHIIDKEKESRLIGEILEAADGDPVLEKVVEALGDGCETPAEIAEEARLDVNDVYQATRRLRRRIEAARKKKQL